MRSLLTFPLALVASACISLPGPSPTPTPFHPAPTPITFDDNGQTWTFHPGDLVVVSLNSTYWEFADGFYNNVLQQVGAEVSSCPMGTTVPGTGCGIALREFRAIAPGTTTVTASRTSCGEAMGCTAAQAHFSVTIVVS